MYDRLIAPIMADGNSQSCNKCHSEGLRLNAWDLGDACQTMACMADKELLNFANPLESRVLEFIDFGRPETGVDIQVEREYDGFMAWIEYGAECFIDACGEMNDPCGGGSSSSSSSGSGAGGGGVGGGGSTGSTGSGGGNNTGGIWGNCMQSDVQQQFDTLVFPFVDGCKACHAEPGDADFDNAKRWHAGNDKTVTLLNMIGSSGMLNTVIPEASQLLTKPLNTGSVFSTVLNATVVGEDHEGGQKLTPAGPNFQMRFDSLARFVLYFKGCHD